MSIYYYNPLVKASLNSIKGIAVFQINAIVTKISISISIR